MVSLRRQTVSSTLRLRRSSFRLGTVGLLVTYRLGADEGETEGSIQLRFDTERAAEIFADELQTGDVLAPGLHLDFDSNQVCTSCESVDVMCH